MANSAAARILEAAVHRGRSSSSSSQMRRSLFTQIQSTTTTSSSSSPPIHINNPNPTSSSSPQKPLLLFNVITSRLRRTYSSSSSSGFFSNSSRLLQSSINNNNNKLLLSSSSSSSSSSFFHPLKSSSHLSNFTTQRQLQLGFYRHLSFKTSSNFTSKFNKNSTKTLLVDKPLSVLSNAFVRYREAVGLQIEAFWRRNYLVLLGVGAFGLCMLLWRIMFGIADTFIGFSEGMAKYGFLALSSAIVAFAGLYVRSRFTINPDKVYRIAMRRLNTSAEILEVMGAPLSGTDLRAYVMSSGGLKLKNFKPKLGGKRCFLIFPIRGSERKGLVSVEVKKRKGEYDMKLLAVDVPMTTGPDQRFFLIGDEEEYKVGGGLISELRDPIVKAMAAVKEFEALDQKEEEEDEERELEEAERKNREEIEKLEKGG